MSARDTFTESAAKTIAERLVGFFFDRLDAHLEERKRHESGEARAEFFARMDAALEPDEK